MISEQEAKKLYPGDTTVIRKGDRDWKSDNHLDGRAGESYGFNPLSKMDQKIRQRRDFTQPQGDPNSLELGTIELTALDGADLVEWRVAKREGEERHVWRRVAIHRNAAR